MSVKSKLLTAAATLIVIGGVSTVGTLSASAVTPQCTQNGNTCVEVFSKELGTPAIPASSRPCSWGSRRQACRRSCTGPAGR